MPDYAYHLLDVFTETKLAGNQLAVIRDGHDIDPERMQMIAREFNLSETVFLLPSSRPEALFSVRIFTPRSELGFAGHPIIGTTVLLAQLGELSTSMGRGSAILDLRAGEVAVTIDDGIASLVAPKPPVILATVGSEALAAAVGLTSSQVDRDLQIASAGSSFAFLRALSPDHVAQAVPDQAAIARLMPPTATGLTLFAKAGPDEYHVRMFAPLEGIFEDPATGSSAAAMAAILLADDPSCAGRTILIRQGVTMGRPSEIYLTPSFSADGTASAKVSGKAVVVGSGSLHL